MMEIPSSGSVIATIASVTFKRSIRGAMIWVAIVCAALPALYALAEKGTGMPHKDILEAAFSMELILLALVASLVVAWPVGEEIDDRTATYLWSRPFARWTILAGKLAALVPVVIAVFLVGWMVIVLPLGGSLQLQPIAALIAGAVAASLAAAALALCMPKHPLAVSMLGLALLDQPIGAMPSSICQITISHQVRVLAGFSEGDVAVAAIALAVIGALWLWLALSRIRRTQL